MRAGRIKRPMVLMEKENIKLFNKEEKTYFKEDSQNDFQKRKG